MALNSKIDILVSNINPRIISTEIFNGHKFTIFSQNSIENFNETTVLSATWNCTGELIAFIDTNHLLHIYNNNTQSLTTPFSLKTTGINKPETITNKIEIPLTFSKRNLNLVYIGYKNKIKIFDCEKFVIKKNILINFNSNKQNNNRSTTTENFDAEDINFITRIKFSMDYNKLVIGNSVGEIVLLNFKNNLQQVYMSNLTQAVTSISFSHFSNLFGSTGDDGILCLFDPNGKSAPIRSYSKLHNGPIKSLEFSYKIKNQFFTVGSDGIIKIHDIKKRNPLKEINVGAPINCMSLSNEDLILLGTALGDILAYRVDWDNTLAIKKVGNPMDFIAIKPQTVTNFFISNLPLILWVKMKNSTSSTVLAAKKIISEKKETSEEETNDTGFIKTSIPSSVVDGNHLDMFSPVVQKRAISKLLTKSASSSSISNASSVNLLKIAPSIRSNFSTKNSISSISTLASAESSNTVYEMSLNQFESGYKNYDTNFKCEDLCENEEVKDRVRNNLSLKFKELQRSGIDESDSTKYNYELNKQSNNKPKITNNDNSDNHKNQDSNNSNDYKIQISDNDITQSTSPQLHLAREGSSNSSVYTSPAVSPNLQSTKGLTQIDPLITKLQNENTLRYPGDRKSLENKSKENSSKDAGLKADDIFQDNMLSKNRNFGGMLGTIPHKENSETNKGLVNISLSNIINQEEIIKSEEDILNQMKKIVKLNVEEELKLNEDFDEKNVDGMGLKNISIDGHFNDTESKSSFKYKVIESVVEESLKKFKEEIREDFVNLQLEIIRQFHYQKVEIEEVFQKYSFEPLLNEITRLREENDALRRNY
ncbi:Protein nedd1 [Lobulomyces angularis]|nr:Protein nedd1 [Lobulomyces angularis]